MSTLAESIRNVARSLVVTADEVRQFTGYTASRDVSDPDLQAIIRSSQSSVLREVAAEVHRLPLLGRRDGSNTRFAIPSQEARVIMDEGLNLATGADDVRVHLRDDSTEIPTWTVAVVTSVDASHGVITLQVAPASSVAAVEFSGWLTERPIDLERLKHCVLLLSAHYTDLRVKEPGKFVLSRPTMQDDMPLQGDEAPVRRGWMSSYKAEVRRLRPATPRVVASDTRLPGAWGL